jgi:hypothetical protein
MLSKILAVSKTTNEESNSSGNDSFLSALEAGFNIENEDNNSSACGGGGNNSSVDSSNKETSFFLRKSISFNESFNQYIEPDNDIFSIEKRVLLKKNTGLVDMECYICQEWLIDNITDTELEKKLEMNNDWIQSKIKTDDSWFFRKKICVDCSSTCANTSKNIRELVEQNDDNKIVIKVKEYSKLLRKKVLVDKIFRKYAGPVSDFRAELDINEVDEIQNINPFKFLNTRPKNKKFEYVIKTALGSKTIDVRIFSKSKLNEKDIRDVLVIFNESSQNKLGIKLNMTDGTMFIVQPLLPEDNTFNEDFVKCPEYFPIKSLTRRYYDIKFKRCDVVGISTVYTEDIDSNSISVQHGHRMIAIDEASLSSQLKEALSQIDKLRLELDKVKSNNDI